MGQELEQTIQNVLKQTSTDFEYLVIDGASTDSTSEILRKYKTKIAKITSQKDTGIFQAMNRGIKLAAGEYLYFLNAGDTFAFPNTLASVCEYLKSNSPDILYGNVKMWDSKVNWLQKFNNINRRFLIQNSICHQAVFTRKDVFTRYGLFDESYQIAGDYDWFTNSWLNSKISKFYVDLTIANFQLTGKSSHPKYRQLVLSECEHVRNKYFHFYEIWIYKFYIWLAKLKQKI